MRTGKIVVVQSVFCSCYASGVFTKSGLEMLVVVRV